MVLVARHPVWQEAPGRGVPFRRKEVAPVFPDEPHAEEGSDFGAAGQFPELGDSAGGEDCEHTEPEGELVDAKAAEVDARTKPVPFEVQHEAKVGLDGERSMRAS